MFSSFRSICSRLVVPALARSSVRRLSIEPLGGRVPYNNNTEVLSDMISSGTHTSTESITRFMNTVYVNKPRNVSLFSFNYKQRTERSTIRGVCIGTHQRRGKPQKNVVVVSGLPLQDPSLIGVGLYVAAVLSRLSPALPHDVAVIPLAHPKEYEARWRSPMHAITGAALLPDRDKEDINWMPHETVTLDLKDTCKPIETYVTRKNKYYINIDVDLSTHGSSMKYKSNSLSAIAAKGKHRTFLSEHSPRSIPLPFPLASPSSGTIFPEQPDPLVATFLQTPSLVLELKGTQPLDDNQVVARGEEVIRMVKQLMH